MKNQWISKKSLAALACIVLVSGCAANKTRIQTGEYAARFEGSGGADALDYLVYVPRQAANHPSRTWPAILFLHGSGERGTNVWQVAKHGPPKIVRTNDDFQFIIISPQCPPGQRWHVDTITALLAEAEARYPIDTNRVYMTGLSMGGAGAWNMILAHPGMFAAAVPVCGRADPSELDRLAPDKLQAVKQLPIWVFHGALDESVPVAQSENMVKALEEKGANVKMTIYPDAPHDCWTRTYSNPELYRWLLSHQRAARNSDSSSR